MRLLWHELDKGLVDLRKAGEQIAATPAALLIDAKGVFDSVSRSESAALPMSDKRSAVEGLALKESIARTRTRLRWIHSEINVADGLTKFDHRACQLVRQFLSASTWRVKHDPTFTSAKKVKAQKAKKEKERRAPPRLTVAYLLGESGMRCSTASRPTTRWHEA